MNSLLTMTLAATIAATPIAEGQAAEPIGKHQITLENDRMTPEALWAMGRIGSHEASPDGRQLLYTVSYYSVEQNKSRTVICLSDINGENLRQLTQGTKSESEPAFIEGGRRIAFLTGGQVWSMNLDGSDRRQLTQGEPVAGFKFSPDGTRVILIREVPQTTSIQPKEKDLPLASGMVLSGQKIIDRGEIVDDYTYRVLNSFEKETQRRSASVTAIPSTIAGQVLFVSILILLFSTYITLFRRDYLDKPRSITMIYTMITLFPVLVSLMMEHNLLSVYVLPFSIAPIFIRVFMDSRTAFIAHVTMVLICAAAVKYQYEFIIVQLVAGLIAIYSLRELSQRAQLFRTALLVTIGSCAIYLALQLMQDNDINDMDNSIYKYFAVNGVLLLFAYPLMLVIEKTFGFISSVTLIELSNTSKDLLRQLSEVAPGTFQHSVMVSNLAAEIANKIGAKAQLVRTGAMYHDIGKMKNPAFFTENQVGVNPLDKMSRIDAAQIVISHVTDGLKLAEKHDLPNVIKDFIKSHHGMGKTKYFYISYKNEHPDEPVDDSLFTYPGPDPFTREQAILMMADTVEAASRSLTEYTEESISGLVNKLIDQQVEEGYFHTCPITFHDIAVAKQVLTERLKAIYHTRTTYPELKKRE